MLVPMPKSVLIPLYLICIVCVLSSSAYDSCDLHVCSLSPATETIFTVSNELDGVLATSLSVHERDDCSPPACAHLQCRPRHSLQCTESAAAAGQPPPVQRCIGLCCLTASQACMLCAAATIFRLCRCLVSRRPFLSPEWEAASKLNCWMTMS